MTPIDDNMEAKWARLDERVIANQEFILRVLKEQAEVNRTASERIGKLEEVINSRVIGQSAGRQQAWINIVTIVSLALTCAGLIIALVFHK